MKKITFTVAHSLLLMFPFTVGILTVSNQIALFIRILFRNTSQKYDGFNFEPAGLLNVFYQGMNDIFIDPYIESNYNISGKTTFSFAVDESHSLC